MALPGTESLANYSCSDVITGAPLTLSALPSAGLAQSTSRTPTPSASLPNSIHSSRASTPSVLGTVSTFSAPTGSGNLLHPPALSTLGASLPLGAVDQSHVVEHSWSQDLGHDGIATGGVVDGDNINLGDKGKRSDDGLASDESSESSSDSDDDDKMDSGEEWLEAVDSELAQAKAEKKKAKKAAKAEAKEKAKEAAKAKKGKAKAQEVTKTKAAAVKKKPRASSYELQRNANIAKNLAAQQKIREENAVFATPPKKAPRPRPRKPKGTVEVTRRSLRGASPSDISTSTTLPGESETAAVPTWLSDAITSLKVIGGRPEWNDLIERLSRLEEALGFPSSGKVCSNLLISTNNQLILAV